MIVAFDLMDTLLVDPYRAAHEAATGLTFAEFEQRRPYGVYYDLERGKIDEQVYWTSLRDHGVPIDPVLFHQTRRGGYRWLPGMRELLTDCRARHRTVIASNYPVWITQVLADTDGLAGIDVFASYQCGFRKPEPAFYRSLAAAFDVTAADLVLIDDKLTNVEAVRALGGRAVRHVTAARTRGQLSALGVPTTEARS